MMREIIAILGLLAATPVLAAGETLPSFGLSSGASPNTLCIFDTSSTRPCVTMGSLNSATHLFTASPYNIIMPSSSNWTPLPVSILYIHGAIVGALGAGQPSAAPYRLNIDSDNVDAHLSGGLRTLYVGQALGGAAMKGNRNGIESFMTIATPTNNQPGDRRFYVGIASTVAGSVNDNGTSAVNSNGIAMALFGLAQLTNTATFWTQVVGMELDVGIGPGSSALDKIGLQIVGLDLDAVKATRSNDAIVIADQVGDDVGWDRGITFGQPNGIWPMDPGGTLIGTESTVLTSPAYAAANGVDFSAVTFSGSAFKSAGFAVDGAGIVTGSAYKTGATAGVTCAGAPTASFASTLGIVTHC